MSGFFGAVSKEDCVSEVFYGTDYHSHLGTKRGGLAYYSETKGFQRAIHSLENSYFRTKFEGDIASFEGKAGIGCISDTEAQPLVIYSKLGRFAITTVSKINNLEQIAQRFLSEGKTFAETSQGGINPTELVAMLICEKETFTEGIKNVYNTIKGSCSILILNGQEIIAGRDKLGRTPIIIGHKDGSFCLASETTSFLNLGYKIYQYLGPGEIVTVKTTGIKTLKKENEEMQICSFLWVYYGYPPSFYEGINVDKSRYESGKKLALADGKMDADFVAGIPDSGIGHALGYSNTIHIPYLRPYAKYTPTWPRSFMPQNQKQRELVAKMKLVPNTALIDGKKGIFLDDSIVRGTQLKDNVKDLIEYGIKEVHMRIACPPLIYPCEYLNFSRSRSSMELATRKAVLKLKGNLEDIDWAKYADSESEEYKAMVEQIRKDLGLTTLKFQKLSDLVEAIGLPKNRLCTHCFDGSSKG
ncbi:MAG: amidophosphoribosyltransferase [Bacteroidales bacterium]|jgi:amidophosphoribosyltransferase|nr:amidophosphoribosyltransferase [Bacteroidales bacterium]MBR6279052.1 amidophosphoribosyltransferase [Bacteroidales bacterium]